VSKKNEGITKGLLGKRVSECTRDELVELLEMVVYNPVDGPFGIEVTSPLGLLTSNPDTGRHSTMAFVDKTLQELGWEWYDDWQDDALRAF
jgi:hypothetical protein